MMMVSSTQAIHADFSDIAIREDKRLKKKVLEQGDFCLFPSEGARITVKISDILFDDGSGPCDVDRHSVYFQSDFKGEFELGDADYFVDEDFERCMQSMSRGEICIFHLEYRDSHGEIAKRVLCRVELIDTTQEVPVSDWEWTRLYEYSERHKKRGVLLVNDKRIADAFRQFSKAYKLLMSTEPYDMEKIPTERFGDLMTLKSKLLSNLAHCQLHYEEYIATIDICNRLIEMDDYNVKGLYRRAVAHIGLQEYEAAYEDLKQVLRIEPNNRDALAKLNIIKPKVKVIFDNYNSVIKKMFSS